MMPISAPGSRHPGTYAPDPEITAPVPYHHTDALKRSISVKTTDQPIRGLMSGGEFPHFEILKVTIHV